MVESTQKTLNIKRILFKKIYSIKYHKPDLIEKLNQKIEEKKEIKTETFSLSSFIQEMKEVEFNNLI